MGAAGGRVTRIQTGEERIGKVTGEKTRRGIWVMNGFDKKRRKEKVAIRYCIVVIQTD